MSGARSESRLESLPMDLLVKIVCHLPHEGHDQLKPVFHVSKRIRKAVQTAKQTHFNYTTPRRRSGRVSTPPAEHLSFRSMGDDGKGVLTPSQSPPPAPRRRRPRSRLNFSDQPLSEPLPLDRALSYEIEDELSRDVAQIQLR